MPRTSDPVTLHEIARRVGADNNRARQWIAQGLLPEPDWTLPGVSYGGGIWAWEKLERHPFIVGLSSPPPGATIPEHAAASGMTEWQIRRAIESGQLAAVKARNPDTGRMSWYIPE